MRSSLPAIFFSLLFLFSSQATQAQPVIDVELVATGFDEPLDIAHAGDARLFIVEREGRIKILHPGGAVTTFLDIDPIVGSTAGEQGLLGMTFHPDYSSNGYFYVNYTDNLGDTHISRFTRDGIDPDLADASSEMELLYMDQPANNHNGGCLKFGPDGYLYIFMGDGGGTGHNRSQDITDNLLGKILRIDVDGGIPYAIPPDNPYVGVEGDDEIWVIGLRNPWRNNFDRLTGDLWIADVGADNWEEIDFIEAGSEHVWNFGWKCYEGMHPREGDICDTVTAEFDMPIFEYPHDIETGGFAVTGGYVYRGTAFPELYGKYFFCDYISGNFWTLEPDGMGGWTDIFYGQVEDHITSFGEDMNGEIYACVNQTGQIFKLVDACESLDISFAITHASASTINNGAVNLTVSGGNTPYTYLWSNGAITEDISGVFANTYSVTVTDANGCQVSGNAVINNLCGPATGVVATPSATSVVIDWNDAGATGYRVMYKPVGPGAFTQVNTPVSSITIMGLSPSTGYTFKIRNKCPGAPGTFSANGNFITTPLKENHLSEQILIYPNPNNGKFRVTGIDAQTEIFVFDSSGRLIKFISTTENADIDLEHAGGGVYFVKCISDHGAISIQKILVE